MQRRTVLLGFGAAAAGSGIVFGSGAFTQVEAERELTIGIDEDSEALLGLVANDDVASVFEDDETGELVIDTEALSDGDEGFNVGSTVQIGQTDETFGDEVDDEDYAFKVVNNFDEDDDGNFDGELDIGVGLPGLEPSESDATLELVATRSGEEEGQTVVGGETKVFEDVESGEEIYVAIRITTDSTSDPEDLEGEVVFQAGANLTAEDFPEEESLVGEGEVRNLDTGDTYDGADAISDAVGEANEGNRLLVGLGTYEESVTIDVEGLTLEGVDEPTITDGVLLDGADDVTLRGLEIEGSNLAGDDRAIGLINDVDGLTVEDSTILTEDVNQGDGILNDWGTEFTNAVIKNNTFEAPADGESSDNVRRLIQVNDPGSSSSVDIIDNTFTGDGLAGGSAVGANADDSEISGNKFDVGTEFGQLSISAEDVDVENNVFEGGDLTGDAFYVSSDEIDLNAVLDENENEFEPDGELGEVEIGDDTVDAIVPDE